MAVSNGKIYAIGGWGDINIPHHTVEEYDPAADSWAKRAPMPDFLSALGAAAAANGKLYVVGDGQNEIISTVGEYDPSSDKWTQKASLPDRRFWFGLATAGNGKLYVVGGSLKYTDALTTVEEYDPVTDRWAAKAAMPTGRQSLRLAAAHNGRLYAVGGDKLDPAEESARTVEEYDPATDSWATKAPMLAGRIEFGLATAGNGKLYAVGGMMSATPSSSMEEYKPDDR